MFEFDKSEEGRKVGEKVKLGINYHIQIWLLNKPISSNVFFLLVTSIRTILISSLILSSF